MQYQNIYLLFIYHNVNLFQYIIIGIVDFTIRIVSVIFLPIDNIYNESVVEMYYLFR